MKRKGPYFLYPLNLGSRGVSEGWKKHFKKSYFSLVVNIFSNKGWLEEYLLQAEYDKLNKVVFKKVLNDSDFISSMFNAHKDTMIKMSEINKKILGVDIKDNKKTFAVLSEFHNLYIDSVYTGSLTWCGAREPLVKFLEEYRTYALA